MNKLQKGLILIASMISATVIYAGEIEYTYAGSALSDFGTGKKEHYDVAIRLTGSSFIGKSVRSVSVPVHAGIEDARIWLSCNLNLVMENGKYVNDPDIMSGEATPDGTEIRLDLDESYTITGDGIFIGYSFDVKDISEDAGKRPVVVDAGISDPDGLYIHSSRTYKEWENISEAEGMVSALKVTLEGDFEEYSVGIGNIPSIRAEIGKPFLQPVTVVNNSTSEVLNISYSYDIEGETGGGHVELDSPLPPVFNSSAIVYLPLPSLSKGNKNAEIRIVEVNGYPNASLCPDGATVVRVVSQLPEKRALMEEYTGTWCGYCVRGIAAMERLSKRYPDNYIGVAYHRGDPMGVTSAFPVSISSLPVCSVDRVIETDPYFGTSRDGFGIENDILSRMETESPAVLDVDAEWDGDDIIAISRLNFVEEPSGNHELAYLLLEDGMHGKGSDWTQTNYYSGENADDLIPEMRQFCEGDPEIRDFHFNDVVVMCSDLHGVPNSVVSPVVDVVSENRYTFSSVMEAVNLEGNPVVQDRKALSVVAVLIEKGNGHVVNSAKCRLEKNRIDSLTDDACVVSTEYHTLSGQKTSCDAKGMLIRTTIWSNGLVTCDKILVR